MNVFCIICIELIVIVVTSILENMGVVVRSMCRVAKSIGFVKTDVNGIGQKSLMLMQAIKRCGGGDCQ